MQPCLQCSYGRGLHIYPPACKGAGYPDDTAVDCIES